MGQGNSHRPVDRLKTAVALLIVLGLISAAIVSAGDEPAAANAQTAGARFTVGVEVVLKVPGLPIFDQEGRVISDDNNLTLRVDRAEAGRLLLVSRDLKVRGWVYEDEVVPLEQATDYFGQAVVNDGRDAEAYWVLGRVWFYRNEVHRARTNLNRAIRLPASRPEFYVSRSLVHMRLKDIRRALDDCDTAIRFEPSLAQARLVREQAERAKHDYAGAMVALEQAFRLDPANPYSRGSSPASRALGPEPADAGEDDLISDTSHASPRPEPKTAAEWVASGENWYSQQEYDKAINDYNAALKVDPRYAPAYTSRARAWRLKHYRDREIADYDAAINLEPGNAVYRVARAESWSARGMHDRAMADYADALRLAPNNPAVWVSRGNEWRKDLKLDSAIADFNQAIRLDPKYAPAYVARANAWKQIRRFDLAIQGFSELIRLDPQDPVAHQGLARILATAHEEQFRNGKWALEEATRACELAHWIDPDALDTLAAASAETGDFESAIKWQILALKLVRQRFPSALQKKAISMGGGRGAGVGFDDRLAFYKSNKPIRE